MIHDVYCDATPFYPVQTANPIRRVGQELEPEPAVPRHRLQAAPLDRRNGRHCYVTGEQGVGTGGEGLDQRECR